MDKIRKAYTTVLLMFFLFPVVGIAMVLVLGEEYGFIAVVCYAVFYFVYGSKKCADSDCPVCGNNFFTRGYWGGIFFNFFSPACVHCGTKLFGKEKREEGGCIDRVRLRIDRVRLRKLTDFQTKCEESLNSALLQIDKKVDNRSLDGEHETFISANISDANISDANIELYIYEHGADFTVNKRSFHFEPPDYSDDDQLISDFVKTVISCAQGDIPKEAGSAVIVLWKGGKL